MFYEDVVTTLWVVLTLSCVLTAISLGIRDGNRARKEQKAARAEMLRIACEMREEGFRL